MARSYETIVERYVGRIVDGELQPGERLPREEDLAAERATAADRAALAERFDALSARRGTRPRDRADALAAERAFHEAIVAAAGNRPLAQILRPVLAALEQAGDRLPARRAELEERRQI